MRAALRLLGGSRPRITSRLAIRHLSFAMSSSAAAAAPASSVSSIPIIDVGALVTPSASAAAKLVVAAEIGDACEKVGFFVIRNHGVDRKVIDAAWEETSRFFDRPVDSKVGEDGHLLMTDTYPYGYSPLGGEVLGKGDELGRDAGETNVGIGGAYDGQVQKPTSNAGDMKEMFAVGPYNEASGMPPPRYPPDSEAFQAATMAYYQSMEVLSAALMRGFALSLGLDEHWFVAKNDRHASTLRALNYPSVSGEVPPEPGQMRASPHTDYGVLTILRSGGAGLQVKLLDDKWYDAPFLEDAFIINLGDLMSRWTNDKWLSTPHRVVVPEDLGSTAAMIGVARRQSMAYFCNLNMDAYVETISTCVDEDTPPKYKPCKAGDHLMAKHIASTQGILDGSWLKDDRIKSSRADC